MYKRRPKQSTGANSLTHTGTYNEIVFRYDSSERYGEVTVELAGRIHATESLAGLLNGSGDACKHCCFSLCFSRYLEYA